MVAALLAGCRAMRARMPAVVVRLRCVVLLFALLADLLAARKHAGLLQPRNEEEGTVWRPS
jgi:hypothetical protein